MNTFTTVTRTAIAWLRTRPAMGIAAAVTVLAVGTGVGVASASVSPPAPEAPAAKLVVQPSTEPAPVEEAPVGAPDVPNPDGGIGSVDLTFDGSTVAMSFTGNCAPGMLLSRTGNASATISGNVSGMWTSGSLCLPNSRTGHISIPLESSSSCHADTQAILTISGTPDMDGTYTVAITGYDRACPGDQPVVEEPIAPVDPQPTQDTTTPEPAPTT